MAEVATHAWSPMTVLVPASIDEAVAALATPGAQLLAGGTDLMVEVNSGHRSLDTVVAIGRLAALQRWEQVGHEVRIGAGVTYTRLLDPDLARLAPALAQAARTVGSPQIRNAGTIGGNLGTASPAGDTLPVLVALDAVAEVTGPAGSRELPVAELITGPKRTGLEPNELIVAVRIPVVPTQEYRKVGVRNAMVIAVASLALVVDVGARTVRCGLGSVGPVPLRAAEAEAWLAGRVDWERVTADPADIVRFAEMVAAAARPIDDHRSTAAYRRHAVRVLAERAAADALAEERAA